MFVTQFTENPGMNITYDVWSGFGWNITSVGRQWNQKFGYLDQKLDCINLAAYTKINPKNIPKLMKWTFPEMFHLSSAPI